MGGWNRKSVMSPNLLVVDRNKQAGASPCDRATLPYHSYTTTIPPIPLLYHKYHFYISPRPHYPFSLAGSPSAMAHAQNARAALRALASSDIASRRRTTRSRLCGNRGPTYVRANSAASSRVRTVATRVRRRGGSTRTPSCRGKSRGIIAVLVSRGWTLE